MNRVLEAFRNCISEPKCKDCPWKECEELGNRKIEIPADLALAVERMLVELIVTQKDIDQLQCESSSYSGELVRCKNCKHGEVWNNCIVCNSGAHNPDWFCADGESR